MSESPITPQLFEHGSAWLRADFHLHTKADKEFNYSGEENSFISNYIEGLKTAQIQLGVITNHNKLNQGEFTALRKKARKEEIYLLPGVELSVNDGANGIHALIVFSEQWLENGTDYILPFIMSMFPGKSESEFQNENGRSDKGILQMVEELEKTARDYFLVFAHVEQNNGLWKEMSGGRLSDLSNSRYETVRKRTLGFQKVRTHDERLNVQNWLKDWYPAEVEGSDCKSINEIGNGEKCFLKLGAFSFDAVKFALTDHESRVSKEVKDYTHSHLKSIRFDGGTISGKSISLSPELNTLIGIRGSGKSSILEALRYVLEIPFGEKAGDKTYKENLVGFTMGSGGKIEIDAVDRYGNPYQIKRFFGENSSDVLIDEKLHPGVSIRETVIHKPIYFGQKDLSNTGKGFEKDLVEKLLGTKLDDIRQEIAKQKVKVSEAVDDLMKVSTVDEDIKDNTEKKLDTEHRLKFYTEHGIEEKLQKRLDYDHDLRKMKTGISLSGKFIEDLESLLASHEDDIQNFVGYESKYNKNVFVQYYKSYNALIQAVNQIKGILTTISTSHDSLLQSHTQLTETRKGMAEEFAEIERKLAEELESSGTQNISSDEFVNLNNTLQSTKQLLEELKKHASKKGDLNDQLLCELNGLNDLWHREFLIIKNELDKVGTNDISLSITSHYKEDKKALLDFTKNIFRGSGIRETTYKTLVEHYTDFIDIYKDLENAKQYFGSKPEALTDLIFKNLKSLLVYQTPNKFSIIYRGEELQHHSLGQRASALILFVLSQQENDVIMIDQPEDDLDNQTIYEDVIKLIRKMKPNVQFIFATHNPNIPVLGDAEQVLACSFEDNKVSIHSGSVDDSTTQKEIVNIMEGGREAFDKRKEIYQIWKP